MALNRIPSAGDLSRRAFLGGAAAAALGATGCLFTAQTELPVEPALWKPVRFAHLTGLHLSFRQDLAESRWALEAARRVRALPEIDFLVLGGGLVKNTGPMDFMLLEEFVLTAGLPWYAVPGESERFDGDDFARRARAAGARAWAPPWEHSPAEGIRLVGLDTGASDRSGADRIESQVPFLTSVLDRSEKEAVIVILSRPSRVPSRAARFGGRRVESEMLRFVLEAAPNVKMVLSGSGGAPFVQTTAGLLGVATPSLSRYPHLFREITLAGHGAVIRNRLLGTPADRETSRKALPPIPGKSGKGGEVIDATLEFERGRKVYALR
jgi:hypothetical protein